jgi:hypothetical protein
MSEFKLHGKESERVNTFQDAVKEVFGDSVHIDIWTCFGPNTGIASQVDIRAHIVFTDAWGKTQRIVVNKDITDYDTW